MKSNAKLYRLLTVLLFCASASTGFSQGLKDVFANKDAPLTYLGIDFTKAKLIDRGDPDNIQDYLYKKINTLITEEPKKYDIASAFNKSSIRNELAVTNDANEDIKADDIIASGPQDFNRLKESDINAVVKKLDLSGKDGVGLLFVMEAMRKVDRESDEAVWVTLVDMKTKKVLMTERMVTKVSGGIGFRNYWASGIRNLIESIEKKKFKEWKSKYAG